MSVSSLSFEKEKRLLNNAQFRAVMSRRVRASDGLLTVYVCQNDCGFARLGVSVSKACGGAVARNRIKRLVREAFRLSQGRIPSGLDYVVLLSAGWLKAKTDKREAADAAMRLKLSEVLDSFLGLVRRLGAQMDKC